MNLNNNIKVLLKGTFILCLLFQYAWSYVGPGAGLTAVGTALGLIVAVILLLIGFVWFPLKKLFGKKKETEPDQIKEDE